MPTAVEEVRQQAGSTARVGWRDVVLGVVLGAAFVYLYAPVLGPLVAQWWDDPDYSHGFLVPVLSAYFVWQRRQKLVALRPQSSLWGLAVIGIGICLLLLGNIGAELFLMRFSIVVTLAGLLVYLWGWRCLHELAFPIGFLLFMIPLPAIVLNAITFPLQLLAAKLSTTSLQLIGMPVYREGNVIFLPHITLEVVEACSGIRSLVSLTALAMVFAYLTQRTYWQRIVLTVSAVPIAIVANAFRIWGSGILASFFGPQVAEDFYHTFAGWLVFVVAFLLLALEGLLLAKLRSIHR